MDATSQIMHTGYVNDWESVGWSALQGSVINIISMMTSLIGGGAGLSLAANLGLNFVMGFPISGISFTIDMLRYYVWATDKEKERKRRLKDVLKR